MNDTFERREVLEDIRRQVMMTVKKRKRHAEFCRWARLLAFCFSGFGLVISNYNQTMQQAMFVLWFFFVVLMLMSGLFTPVRSMPRWAYLTTFVNPVSYFIEGIRTVFVRGGDFQSILPQLLGLSVFALFFDTWAILSYRKNE